MNGEVVSFTAMVDGTAEDYRLLDRLERRYAAALPERLAGALRQLDGALEGYQVSRLTHSLQTATRAERDGADEEMVAAALLHDLGDVLAPWNHAEYAAAILRPYVRDEVTWIVAQHGVFQLYYYAHHFGRDREARRQFRGHPWFGACERFCALWDQPSFDPAYPTEGLDHFLPLLQQVFSRPKPRS